MKYKGKDVAFPATIDLSFHTLISSLKKKKESCSSIQVDFYNMALKIVEDNPWLNQPITDEVIEKEQEIIDEFLSVLFPAVLETNEIKAVTKPWDFSLLTKSKRLDNILKDAGDDFQIEFAGLEEDNMFISGCATILGMHYHYPIPMSRMLYFSIPNQKTGKSKTYRMTMNAEFITIDKTSKSLEITQDDYNELLDNYYDINIWKKKFPVGSWKMSGFLLLSLTDVTNERIISSITENLLQASDDGFAILEKGLSDLLEVDVTMSFVNLDGVQLVQGKHPNLKPLMLGSEDSAPCNELLCEYTYKELIENDRAIAIPNIDAYHKKANNILSANLKKTGLGSYFNAPIVYNDLKLGFIELGAVEKGVLNSSIGTKLEEVLPILAIAGNRMVQEQKNRIDALIQEEFTTIHPSVKWKFEEEAYNHITAIENGDDHQFKDLVFADVFPLFGQLDIRSSSTIRNEAIKNDLLSQLEGARTMLFAANKLKSLPIYDELIFTVNTHINQLQEDMVSASEQDILSFFRKELEPILKHISTTDDKLKIAFRDYENSLNEDLHFVYNERRDFDESVNMVNSSLSKYLDAKQDEAQEMFPHHFERYKTDGVEFNMYIGESISPKQGFHKLMVKNLRLWQLMVMIEMERLHKLNQKKMKKPLDVASLILVFSNSLSIQFRMDEKRFDVEGAYNARYEIIKKRIDKAHIKGTNERITTPGKLVIVFSREEDEQEYIRYVNYLQNKGYLMKEKVETVTLEDLDGVSGLRAIRPNVNYGTEGTVSDLTIEEIIAEIESGE